MAKQPGKKKEKAAPTADQLQAEIRELAEKLSKDRGNNPGDALSDWLEAEKQVKKKYKF